MINNKAFDKFQQTLPLFKKIIDNLEKQLAISFKFTRVFNDGKYYRIVDNIDCMYKLITHVNKGKIFAERNITNTFDTEYVFTLWPEIPTYISMKIYHEHGIWNGITLSKKYDYYTDMYSFSGKTAEKNWSKFFSRNKPLLMEFVKYFNSHIKILHIPEVSSEEDLFIFQQGFDFGMPESKYLKNEALLINNFLKSLPLHSNQILDLKLSNQETKVLTYICRGYTAKLIAQKLDISVRTVECYVGRIKDKTGLRYKTDLLKLGENLLNKTL